MKNQNAGTRTAHRAFTLLEVMFAVGIFCMATFSILALVSNSLSNARRLQRPMVDAGALAGELSQTNQLVEGIRSDSLNHLLGDTYRGYTWTREIREVQTNKLFQVDFVIQGALGDKPVSKMRILLFRPNSPAGSLDGATVARP
jgi:type II secretory pathway component PulJ